MIVNSFFDFMEKESGAGRRIPSKQIGLVCFGKVSGENLIESGINFWIDNGFKINFRIKNTQAVSFVAQKEDNCFSVVIFKIDTLTVSCVKV